MLITDKEAVSRLSSPANLINKLTSQKARTSAMSLFGIGRKDNEVTASPKMVSVNPTVDTTVKEADKDDCIVSFNPFQKKAAQVQSSQSGLVVAASTIPARLPQAETKPAVIPQNPLPPVALEDILEDSDRKIKLSLAHDEALGLLTDSVSMLRTKLDDVNAAKLPGVISAASKVVEGIRKERIELSKSSGAAGKSVHYHFYTPAQKKITDYEIIEVQ